MTEIRYDNQQETADLAGRSIADVREQYRSDLDIPDSARAKLNGKNIKRKLEPDTVLKDNDELLFVKRSKKVPLLSLALLAAIAATVVPFAAATPSTTVSGNVTQESDFVSVITSSTAPSWTTYGRFTGRIEPQAEVFKVIPANGFSGDLVVLLSLTNADELVGVYQSLSLRLSAEDGTFSSVVSSPSEVVLSLQRPLAEIEITGYDAGGDGTKYIDIALNGGYYQAHSDGGWTSGHEDPHIYCEVIQKGAP